ncbi:MULTISPECIES: DUF4197 domain-containing protein [Dyadobacter]|jgi:hypothetical protein|uniref:DUF4197 domain-containing protein n=1 Tax=Dyadobacter chenhuakuii TaxID=2909339 RepID=A0ABY4XPT7_9BACT|nr:MULTISPECIES: DUF4197 domain-containing protein [Dyadobacter]MCE7072443.1 DUF4197 domain-containing protein [Dyadobacter sp. CY327]MCF2494507.1 DUF4197 domain-containing protein [Dyadobacter chenhuakuii]USJ32169.1 DUF4197 domain-containing protein [Dyadobacter chenhuakuii]
MNHKILAILIFSLLAATNSQAQFNLGKVLDKVSGKSDGLGENEIVSGLKEALNVGISNGSAEASKVDGFFKNELIKIAVPPEAQKVAETLRKMGLGDQVDKFTLSLNRAAEDAAKKSKPIFVKAITSMTVPDALGILKGQDDAATQYLKKTTNEDLYKTFFPVVDSTLNLNKATDYYKEIVDTYNKIPLVKKVNPDLKGYATQKTIDGLYILIAQEEKKIREDPKARVTDLLKKVFKQAAK